MANFQVLFSGEVAPNADEQAVRTALMETLTIDERKAAQLFSGRTVVIRSQLKESDAVALQQRLRKLGAVCRIKDLTPKNPRLADPWRDKEADGRPDQTLRDITAAHTECPRCGHMQLEAVHCTRCGVDIAAAVRQHQKEEAIIEKKIRELRSARPAASGKSGRTPLSARIGSKPGKGKGWFRKSP